MFLMSELELNDAPGTAATNTAFSFNEGRFEGEGSFPFEAFASPQNFSLSDLYLKWGSGR